MHIESGVFRSENVIIHQVLMGGFKNFIYLILGDGIQYIVDAQKDFSPFEMRVKPFDPDGLLLTHSHWDHMAGVSPFLEKYTAPIYLHKEDFHRVKPAHGKPDRVHYIHDGDQIPLCRQESTLNSGHVDAAMSNNRKLKFPHIEVMHTPGHSSGECCFYIHDGNDHFLLTGDTIFKGEVGRTDLETGSDLELFKSIQRIKSFPEHTVILPGHDYGDAPYSTIEIECATSSAFKCKSVEELAALP